MLCIPLNLLLSDHLGLEHAGELNDVGCKAECVCVHVHTNDRTCAWAWWNHSQVSTFLLLGCILFAFFSRPDCWLPALTSAWPFNSDFIPLVSEPCLGKSADCPPVFQMPLTSLVSSKGGMLTCVFELGSKEVRWRGGECCYLETLPGIAEWALSEDLPLICWVIIHWSLPISGP